MLVSVFFINVVPLSLNPVKYLFLMETKDYTFFYFENQIVLL